MIVKKFKDKIFLFSEKLGNKIGLDLPYFVKNGFWVFLRQGIGSFCGLALSIAFARLATQEVFGQYQFILSILSIVSILSIPGLNTSIIRSVAKGYDGDYKKSVRVSFFWSLLGVPILLFVGGYYYAFQSHTLGLALMISSIFFPLFYAPNTWDSFLQGKSRFDISTKYSLIQSFLNSIATIVVIFFVRDNLIPIVITYLISYTFFNVFYYYKSLKYIENEKKDRDIIKYGWFLTKINIFTTIINNFDSILVMYFLGFEKIAIYKITLQMVATVKDLSKSFYKIIFPKVASFKNPIDNLISKKNIFYIFFSSLIVAILLILFSPFLIKFLFTNKYNDSIILFQLLIMALPIWTLNSLFISIGEVNKNNHFILLINIVPYIIQLIATCLFVFYPNLLLLIFGQISFSVTITIISVSILFFRKNKIV